MDTKDLRRACRYVAGRAFIEATARLPVGAGRVFYRGLGRLAWHVVRRDRRIARGNLAMAFPEMSPHEVDRAGREVFQSLTTNIFDVAAYPRWGEARRARELRVEGIPILREALAAGRGALLFGGHQGAWELIAAALVREGIRTESLARRISEPRLDRWLREHRAALGVVTLPRDGLSAALAARRALRRGHVVGVLLDHKVRRGGVLAPFFGRPTRFAGGPIRLALRAGAPVLPVQIGRASGGGHLVRIGRPVPRPDPSLPAREAGEAAVRTCVAELEAMIRRSPAEWAWIHPRWRRGDDLETGTGAGKRPATAECPVAASRAGSVARGLAALFAVAAVALSACGRSGPQQAGRKDESDLASVTRSFQLRETLNGRLRWVLKADSAETFEKTDQTQVFHLQVDFIDEDADVYSVLTADRGVVQRGNNDMSARGNVRLVTRAGDTLTTEALDWNNARSRVRTTEPFRLGRPGGVLRGVGFESDPGLKNYTTEEVRIDARSGGRGQTGGS